MKLQKREKKTYARSVANTSPESAFTTWNCDMNTTSIINTHSLKLISLSLNNFKFESHTYVRNSHIMCGQAATYVSLSLSLSLHVSINYLHLFFQQQQQEKKLDD
jgi:hypothetical protein